jgi:hypothetical protein
MVTLISYKASSDEINGIASRAITCVNNQKTIDKVVSTLIAKMTVANDKLTIALKQKKGNDATPLVQELESKRDKGLKGFFKSVTALTFSLNADIEVAAKKLLTVIKRNGITMYNLPQDKQTSAMASLFKELEQPELVAAIELTNTKILLDDAKAANLEYLTELANRGSQEVKKDEPELVSTNVKLVRVNFEKLMNHLDSYLAALEDDTLRTIYNELTDIIDKANAIIKARSTRKNTDEKENGKKMNGKTDETKKE